MIVLFGYSGTVNMKSEELGLSFSKLYTIVTQLFINIPSAASGPVGAIETRMFAC